METWLPNGKQYCPNGSEEFASNRSPCFHRTLEVSLHFLKQLTSDKDPQIYSIVTFNVGHEVSQLHRNLFDLLLVVMSLIDFMVFRLLQNGAGFTEVKLLKTLRIMRVFRVFRFFRQLTQLALMITAARRRIVKTHSLAEIIYDI